MLNRFCRGISIALVIGVISCLGWIICPDQALAVNNPELLPNQATPIVDLANYLPAKQEEALIRDIETFQGETGWKMRVLTQYDRSPGRAVINFWGLDDKSILLVADGRGGNLLSFSIGDAVYEFLPRTFWIELQARFGNMYFVRENGENNAIVQSLDTVKGCLVKGGCAVVPGLPREQWILTLITSIVGALWFILFVAFGIGPVVTRTSELLPLFRNLIGFALGVLVAYLSPRFNSLNASKT